MSKRFGPGYTDLGYLVLTRKLAKAAELEDGWDGYDAAKPSAEVVTLANKALEFSLQMLSLPSSIVASADGGIALCWDFTEKHAYIEFGNDNTTISAMYVGANTPIISEIRSTSEILKKEISAIQLFMNQL